MSTAAPFVTPAVGEAYRPFRRFKGVLIPETLLKRIVSRGAAYLYGQLARYAGDNGLCFVGQARVAADFMVTIRTVQRWLSELVKKGFIRPVRRGAGTRTNAYTFLWHQALDPAQLELPMDGGQPPPPPAGNPPPRPVEIARKPVQKEWRSYSPIRQKCRVNEAAFLSEEAQGFGLVDTSRGGCPVVSPVENPPRHEPAAAKGTIQRAGDRLRQIMPGWVFAHQVVEGGRPAENPGKPLPMNAEPRKPESDRETTGGHTPAFTPQHTTASAIPTDRPPDRPPSPYSAPERTARTFSPLTIPQNDPEPGDHER